MSSLFLYFLSNNFISSWFADVRLFLNFCFLLLKFYLANWHSYLKHGLELRNLFSIVLFLIFAKFSPKSSFPRLNKNLREIICEWIYVTLALTPRILFFSLSILSDSIFVLNSAYFSVCHLFHFFFFNDGEKWHSLLPGLHLILKVYFGFSALCCLLILLTHFVCLYNYEFWLSLCKIVRSSVILLLPLLFIN